MELLHSGVQGSCEFMVFSDLALIRYRGCLTFRFFHECIKEKLASGKFESSVFFLLDLRESQLDVSRKELVQIAKYLGETIPVNKFLAFLVDKPLETALIYLLREKMARFDVRIFISLESAISDYLTRVPGSRLEPDFLDIIAD